MTLPLPEPIAGRLAAGGLVRVNEDGTPYSGSAEPAEAGDTDDEGKPARARKVK
jgi:hypothetical protein